MTVFLVILGLVLVIVFLIWWISRLIKKNKELKEKVEFLQHQKEVHLANEKRKNEKLEKISNPDGSINIDATNDLLQELSERRTK